MAKEIERKFKVRDLSILNALTGQRITQSYLSAARIVTRVRVIDDVEAFLTIKGPSNGAGSCDEFEYSIPLADAKEMLFLCGARIIDKTRYKIPAGNGLTFELDVFHGLHEGLVVVEVELPSIDTPVDLPAWVGEEVTGDYHYANAYLATQFEPQAQ